MGASVVEGFKIDSYVVSIVGWNLFSENGIFRFFSVLQDAAEAVSCRWLCHRTEPLLVGSKSRAFFTRFSANSSLSFLKLRSLRCVQVLVLLQPFPVALATAQRLPAVSGVWVRLLFQGGALAGFGPGSTFSLTGLPSTLPRLVGGLFSRRSAAVLGPPVGLELVPLVGIKILTLVAFGGLLPGRFLGRPGELLGGLSGTLLQGFERFGGLIEVLLLPGLAGLIEALLLGLV